MSNLDRELHNRDVSGWNHVKGMSAQDELAAYRAEQEAISELAEQYVDDNELLWDAIISEGLCDSDQICGTIRAMINCYELIQTAPTDDFRESQEKSMSVFAKSLAVHVLDGVAKRAELVKEGKIRG